MKRILPAALLLALAAHADAAPPEVPKEPVRAAVGEDVVVVVKVADGKKGAFGEGFRAADCVFFRGYSSAETEMTFLVRPKRPGYYRVVFWTVGEADRSFLDIDAGDAPPSPPGPGPAPGPTNPFTKAVQEAYAAEADPAKAKQAEWLAAIYRGAPALLDAPGADTAGGLFAKLKAAIHNPASGIPEGSLPKVSKVIGADLNVALGGTAAGVDPGKPVDKAAAKAAFARYASALGGLPK